MIVSRGISTLRFAKVFAKPSKWTNQINITARKSHDWCYRTQPKVDPKIEFLAEIAQGYAWWWLLWHLWTEPGHILGEFEYPDPRKWTNEELGIPS